VSACCRALEVGSIYQRVSGPKIGPGVGLGCGLLVATGAVALAGAVGLGCAATLVVALGLLAGAPLVHEDRMRAPVSATMLPIRHLFLVSRRLLGINLIPPLLASTR
jgi:hypothetical protein